MKVRLYKPHTHDGLQFTPPPEGMDVDLPADAVRWLRENTAALTAPPAAARTTAPTKPIAGD